MTLGIGTLGVNEEDSGSDGLGADLYGFSGVIEGALIDLVILESSLYGFSGSLAGVSISGTDAYLTGNLYGFSGFVDGQLGSIADNTIQALGFATAAEWFGGGFIEASGFATQAELLVGYIPSITIDAAGFATEADWLVDFIDGQTGESTSLENVAAGFATAAEWFGGAVIDAAGFATVAEWAVGFVPSLSIEAAGFATQADWVVVSPTSIHFEAAGFATAVDWRVKAFRLINGQLKEVVDATGDWLSGADYANLADPAVLTPPVGDVAGYDGQDALVMNTTLGGASVTRYQNFPFAHLVKIQDVWYGVRHDGLYRIGKDLTADNGVSVSGKVLSKDYDYGTFHSKRASKLWVNSDTQTLWTPFTDGNQRLTYPSSFSGRKVSVGRGLTARYWQWAIADIVKLEGFEVLVDQHMRQRRVK